MTTPTLDELERLHLDALAGVPIDAMQADNGSLNAGDRSVGCVNISGATNAQDLAVARWLAALHNAAPSLLALARAVRALGEARAGTLQAALVNDGDAYAATVGNVHAAKVALFALADRLAATDTAARGPNDVPAVIAALRASSWSGEDGKPSKTWHREWAAEFYLKLDAASPRVADWIDGRSDGADVDQDIRDLAELLREAYERGRVEAAAAREGSGG